jgi:hypothetical protein
MQGHSVRLQVSHAEKLMPIDWPQPDIVLSLTDAVLPHGWWRDV